MSRPIKFRVRDAKGSLIGYNHFDERRWSCQMLKAGGSGEWSNGVLHGPHMDQFTGLTDKNGVEIYEGDIIKNVRGPLTAIVHWDAGSGGWIMKYLPNPGTNYTRGWSVAAEWARYEVIGSIHENPELLTPEGGK